MEIEELEKLFRKYGKKILIIYPIIAMIPIAVLLAIGKTTNGFQSGGLFIVVFILGALAAPPLSFVFLCIYYHLKMKKNMKPKTEPKTRRTKRGT